MIYHSNIEEETLKNDFYRKVLFTGSYLQLVVMSLKVGEEIPFEVHSSTDQFIRVEKGEAEVTINEEISYVGEDEIVIMSRCLPKPHSKGCGRHFEHPKNKCQSNHAL